MGRGGGGGGGGGRGRGEENARHGSSMTESKRRNVIHNHISSSFDAPMWVSW